MVVIEALRRHQNLVRLQTKLLLNCGKGIFEHGEIGLVRLHILRCNDEIEDGFIGIRLKDFSCVCVEGVVVDVREDYKFEVFLERGEGGNCVWEDRPESNGGTEPFVLVGVGLNPQASCELLVYFAQEVLIEQVWMLYQEVFIH